MDASFVIDVLREALPAATAADAGGGDMPTITVASESVRDVCAILRDHPSLQFALLVDVTAADYLPASPRFEVVYHFACLGDAYATGAAAPARRLRMKARVAGEDPRLPSIVPVYPAANWLEREVYDLMGVIFEDHPDLRRILTPDGWEGHPLRKDYPVQVRKDAASWEPVQVSLEEFTATIRAERERATARASHPHKD